ncbi:hypothetical protein SAY87_013224 [Trapa incisa]|uniref:Uncharacterized protein n=2 Tax=Trapa TaxID=22665 RepID=A0AAN7K813_TRANT|nr:hypothetical protein SAY86_008173 [Trapa natans]KAK4763786.1 hypothetical protein SAY87_013224 [Trapa incisa]
MKSFQCQDTQEKPNRHDQIRRSLAQPRRPLEAASSGDPRGSLLWIGRRNGSLLKYDDFHGRCEDENEITDGWNWRESLRLRLRVKIDYGLLSRRRDSFGATASVMLS